MSVMPDRHIFRLKWATRWIYPSFGKPPRISYDFIECTPTNWGEMSIGLSRELFAIKRESTSRLMFTGEAATIITDTLNGEHITKEVFLELYRRNEDWSMTIVRTWKADLSTYERDGDTVSLEFSSSSVREEIERNKGTAYEILH